MSAVAPTRVILSPRTAKASAHGRAGSAVKTRALTTMRSGGGAAACAAPERRTTARRAAIRGSVLRGVAAGRGGVGTAGEFLHDLDADARSDAVRARVDHRLGRFEVAHAARRLDTHVRSHDATK